MAYKPLNRRQHICPNLPSPPHFRPRIKAIKSMARQVVAFFGPAPAAEEQPERRLCDTRKTGGKPTE